MRLPFAAVVAPAAMVWAAGGCAGAQQAAPPPAAEPVAETTPAAAPPPRAPEPPPPPVPPPPSAGNVAADALGAMLDAFNAHDADKLADRFADDCAVDPYDGPPIHGRGELAAAARRTFEAFADVKAATLRGWVKDRVVVSELAWSATMTGDFLGLKATHRSVGLIAVRVLHLGDDGRVKTMHEYADAAALADQMAGKKGAMPPPILPSNTLELHVAKGTPDEDSLGAWVRGVSETLAKDDPKAPLAAMAAEGDYWTNFGGPAVRGRPALERGLVAWFTAFPDQKWTVSDAWGVDGFAIVEHAMSGTQKGPLGAHRASKKAVSDWRWVDILQPAPDGKVLHGWGFTNMMEMLQQTGAIRQPERNASNVAPSAGPTQGTAPAPKKP